MKGNKDANTNTGNGWGVYALKIKRGGRVRVEIGGERMLNRQENEVMNAVYSLCHEKGICLVSPTELLAMLPPRKKITLEKLEDVLNQLSLDQYFELLSSERKGEKMYVISLRSNGYAFKRGYVQMRRDAFGKIFWAVISAVVAFAVGVILKRIF